MNGRTGLTLVEVIVVVAIVAILAALVTPSLMEARRAGQRTRCMSNLRQIHLSIGLYRAAEGKEGALGEPADMGLPSVVGFQGVTGKDGLRLPAELLTCRGQTARPRPPIYSFHFIGHPITAGQETDWARLVRRYGDEMVLVSDPNHDFATAGQFSPARTHRGLAVYLAGHVRVVIRRGMLGTNAFYLQEEIP